MATTKIPKVNQSLVHFNATYESQTDTTSTGTSVTLRTGSFVKTRSDTKLQVLIFGYCYVNTQSGGFYLDVDGSTVASAITTMHGTESLVVNGAFVNGIASGSHNYTFILNSQSTSSTATIPSWSRCTIMVSEVY